MSLTSNLTAGFIDLATFDQIEKYMYSGPTAVAYFVRSCRKSTWFTQVPVCLSVNSGSPGFGTDWSVNVSRAGDYLLSTWLRVTVSAVAPANAAKKLRWTRNFMHNLIQEAYISFNDLTGARFDNYHLDFWSAFTVPASKANGYENMIGNFPAFSGGVAVDGSTPTVTLNLPLPFFFSRDSGVALPTAALPYNEIRIGFQFRDWRDLLMVDDSTAALNLQTVNATLADVVAAPTLQAHVWANYAIVSNEERQLMACSPRDILIEQAQTIPRGDFTPALSAGNEYNARLSHAIKVIFFAARNNTVSSQWSNYETKSYLITANGAEFSQGVDPISTTALVYENTSRLAYMGSDYYSLINPWYHAPTIPSVTGYHMYSYSLDFYNLDPMGSTNYGKLTNVTVRPVPSAGAIAEGADPVFPQKFQFLFTAVNNNIIRISGGALGFPVV